MTVITTVTQKGQVTIPVAMRRKLGIEPYDKVEITFKNGQIGIEPVEDIFDLAGFIKAPKGVNALKAREYMEKNYKRI